MRDSAPFVTFLHRLTRLRQGPDAALLRDASEDEKGPLRRATIGWTHERTCGSGPIDCSLSPRDCYGKLHDSEVPT